MPVGRLDFMTEGLLLLTNDGELKRQLELPRTGVAAHLPRPRLRHGQPGAARGAGRGHHHRGHPLRLDRRQSRAPHRAQLLDRDEPDRRQEPRGPPRARTSRAAGLAPDPHRLRPVRRSPGSTPGAGRRRSTASELEQFRRSAANEDHRRRVARAADRGAAGRRRPGRPPTGCAKPCSRCWSAASARSTGLRVADLFAGSGALGLRGAVARRGARRPSSRMTPRRSRRSAPMPASSARASGSQIARRLGARAAPRRAVRPDLRRPALCARVGQRRGRGGRRGRLARAGRLAGGRNRARRPGRRRRPGRSRPSATSAARGLRFCGALAAFDAFLISSISSVSRRPIAAAAALPAALTALPAAFVLPARLLKPLLGERGQRGRRGDREQVGDQRALEQLDEGVGRRPSSDLRRAPRALRLARCAARPARPWLAPAWPWPRSSSCLGLGHDRSSPVRSSKRSTHDAHVRIRERPRKRAGVGALAVSQRSTSSPGAASPASPWDGPRRPSRSRRRSGRP